MLKRSWQPVVWSVVYYFILLSIFTPLNVVAVSFIMIPVLILYVKTNPKTFAACYALTLVAAYLSAGVFGNALVFISLFFLIPVIVIGQLYKKKASARAVLTSATMAILAELLLLLIVGSLFGVNVQTSIREFLREGLSGLPEQWRSALSDDFLQQLVRVVTQMIPLYIISFSFYYAVITHWIARRILNRMGESIPGLRPAKEWMLPKSLVWYYLVALILDMFVPKDSTSALNMILLNLIPLLMFAFYVQAIGFLFYVSDAKNWGRWLPYAGIASFVLLPPAHYFLSLLGVFDIAFSLRSRITKK